MNKYQQLINQGYNFSLGRYISEGWDIFKKGAGSFIGFTVVFFIIYFILSLIPFVNFLAGFIIAALTAGVYIYCYNLLHGGREDFGNFFEGFKDLGQIFLFQLILFLFFVPLLVLFFTLLFPVSIIPDIINGNYDPQVFAEEFTASFQNNGGLIALVYLLFLAGSLYLYTSYSLVLPLIVISKMGFWEAMETSRKIVAKNFFGFLGLILILGLMLIAGSLVTCGLGILLLLPYVHCVFYAAYDDIIKPEVDTLQTQMASFGTQEKDVNTEAEDNRNSL